MTSKRLCYEPGHKPKCLVIVDDTAEWDRAVYYASRWAIRAGGGVVMLRIIEPEQQSQESPCWCWPPIPARMGRDRWSRCSRRRSEPFQYR